jgi:hypothetical protein
MVRRLPVWLVVLTIVGTPLASVVCAALCDTARAHQVSAQPEHHAHHHSDAGPAVPAGAAIRALHGCTDAPGDAVATLQAAYVSNAPVAAAVPLRIVLAPEHAAAGAAWMRSLEHSPPADRALLAHLRV